MYSQKLNSAAPHSVVLNKNLSAPPPGRIDLSEAQALSVQFVGGCEYESPIPVPLRSDSAAPIQAAFASDPIRIRPLHVDDVPLLYAAALESLNQLCRWMTWPRPDYSIEQCRSFVLQSIKAWQKGEYYTFAIVDVRDGTLLGSIALNHLNQTHHFANVGYWVRSTRTRSGVASAATLQAASFGFRQLGLNRLEFLVPTDNVPSQRVAQRAGAKFERIFHNRLVLCGMSCDAVVYSLVHEDLPRVI